MIYLELFWSFFQIGLFSIGGGYAAMPLVEQQAVIEHGWISAEGFADIITIAEMTPGPISLNAATFVGNQVAGFLGALIATIGCIVPSTIIVFIMALMYYRYREVSVVDRVLKGVRPAIIALIASAGVTILCMAVYGSREISGIWTKPNYIAIVIILGTLIIIRKKKLKPIYAIMGSGIVFGVISIILNNLTI